MNIFSLQFEDFFHHFSWGGTSGDELHQVCFVWDSFYSSFISERQLFWKEYSWLAGFSLLALWVCPWMEARLHWWWENWWGIGLSAMMPLSPHHAGGLKVNSPPLAKYFLGFFFHGICASCHLKYHLNWVAFSCEFSFWFIFGCACLCHHSAWASQCGGFSGYWLWAPGCWLQ